MSQQGERPTPVTAEEVVERLLQFERPSERVLLMRTNAFHFTQCERDLVAFDHSDRIKVAFDGWVRVSEAKGLYRALAEHWNVSWADCNCHPEGTWTAIWTLGTPPLRVWTRKGLRLKSDGENVWGTFNKHVIPRSDVVAVEAASRWLGLRCAVVLRTRTQSLEVHGELGDADDEWCYEWAGKLAARIAEKLRLTPVASTSPNRG